MFVASEQKSVVDRMVAILIQIFPRLMGMMFVYAGYQKLFDHRAMFAVLEFDGFSEALVPVVGWTVIWTELTLGALLILLRPRRWLLGITGGVLVVFLGQLAFLLLSEDAPNYCGCELLSTVLAVQAEHHHNHRNMLLVDTVLLLAVALTWLQLPPPKRSVPPPTIDI